MFLLGKHYKSHGLYSLEITHVCVNKFGLLNFDLLHRCDNIREEKKWPLRTTVRFFVCWA